MVICGKYKQQLCPLDLLKNPIVEDLNYWLSRLVDVCNQDGKPYSPRIIHQILSGMQSYILQEPNSTE